MGNEVEEEQLYNPLHTIASMTNFDLGFITALIEGEGEVNISYVSSKSKHDGHIYRYVLTPRISISNGSLALMERAKEILGVGIISHKKGKPHRKPLHQLEIRNYSDVDKVCKMVMGHALSKRRQFELLDEFVHSRMMRSQNYRGEFPYLAKPPYNDRELELFKLIKQENDYRGKGYGRWEHIYAFKKEMLKNEQ